MIFFCLFGDFFPQTDYYQCVFSLKRQFLSVVSYQMSFQSPSEKQKSKKTKTNTFQTIFSQSCSQQCQPCLLSLLWLLFWPHTQHKMTFSDRFWLQFEFILFFHHLIHFCPPLLANTFSSYQSVIYARAFL